MTRRKSVNKTGISHISDVRNNDIWVSYTCVNCGEVNLEDIGLHVITADEAYEKCCWKCKHCGYVHSKSSDLPEKLTNWDEAYRKHDSLTCERFWRSFFFLSTASQENYWKQCATCGRVLPAASFGKHKGWSELEKQQECKSCKAAINAIGNPKRTKEQLHEGSASRRIGDLMSPDPNFKPYSDIEDLFKRFDSKCFKTGVKLDIYDREKWEIDHILPSAFFYPLTKENAALLSKEANGSKRAQWPSEVYSNEELVELARITGADLSLLTRKTPVYNKDIDPNLAVKRYIDKARSQSDLAKRVEELKKVLTKAGLIDLLSDENKKILGL